MILRPRLLVLALLAVPALSTAQADKAASKPDPLAADGYTLPPADIMEAVLAPWYKNVTPSGFSPSGDMYLRYERAGMPKLADLGRPHVNLAGMDVDTIANRARSLTVRSAIGLSVVPTAKGAAIQIPMPAGAKVSDANWSPDGRTIAYLLHKSDRTELWTFTPASKANRRLTDRPLLATLHNLEWVGGDALAVTLIPKVRPKATDASGVASSPRVALSEDKKYSLRTYQSLLDGPDDAARFEFFATGQLALVGLDGKVSEVGAPKMYSDIKPSPDGKYLWVTTVERPFSYLFPYGNFGQREVILDRAGKELVQIRKRGLQTGNGGGGNEAKRSLEWRPDGKGLSYLAAAARAEGQTEGPRGDRVVLWKAPFGDKDTEDVYVSKDKISSVRYAADGSMLFLTTSAATAGDTAAGPRRPGAGGGGKSKTVVVKPGSDPVTLFETTGSEGEDVPSLVTMSTPEGLSAVRIVNGYAALQGTERGKDLTKEAPQPWLDKVSLTDGKRERIWQSRTDMYETASFPGGDSSHLLVNRQSPTQVPNTVLRSLSDNSETALTANTDYLPDLTQARRERIQITRNDGFKFWATVTYPKYYSYGRLPAFFWFYPSEFVDQAAYDKSLRTQNINLFRSISASNKAILVRHGYLLVEPDCPIVGPADRKNDAYVPQLRNNLSATIDALDKLGVIDRARLGLGGHSYGAFSTVNAMVNTPFFKAGIAGDGNYNRLLTPFGFQSDQRMLWDARETYLDVSPILHADQLTGALLMYHGMEDQNVGTDPINSERLFAALQSLGKPAALYMYPYEDHGQIAQETVLDQWARWIAWLDKYLKKG